jgi:hypothetical protein
VDSPAATAKPSVVTNGYASRLLGRIRDHRVHAHHDQRAGGEPVDSAASERLLAEDPEVEPGRMFARSLQPSSE